MPSSDPGTSSRVLVRTPRPAAEECSPGTAAMLGSHGGEGLPMSLLIPAAMGRPIICSDTSGNRDLVIDGENGHLFPAGDIDAIMETVRMIIKDDLNSMGVRSHQLIFDRGMDADTVHRRFTALYAG